MRNLAQSCSSIQQCGFGLPAFALALFYVLPVLIVAQPLQAQTLNILYSFS